MKSLRIKEGVMAQRLINIMHNLATLNLVCTKMLRSSTDNDIEFGDFERKWVEAADKMIESLVENALIKEEEK